MYQNGEIRELSDESWYRTINAADLVNSSINRIDDEVEAKGRTKACGLLSKVCIGRLTPENATKEFSEHIKSVLTEIINDNFLTQNWDGKEKQIGKEVAKQLISEWETIPDWRTLGVHEKDQDYTEEIEKKDSA
jgi:hypothetical protein